MIKQWRKTVHRTLPEHHLRYNKSVGLILSAFVNDVVATATAICPQVSEPLGLWKQSVLKGAKPLKDNAEEIFQNKIKNTARDAHQIIAPKIKEFWLPTYEKCGAEHGMLIIRLLKVAWSSANMKMIYQERVTLTAISRPTLTSFRRMADPCIKSVLGPFVESSESLVHRFL